MNDTIENSTDIIPENGSVRRTNAKIILPQQLEIMGDAALDVVLQGMKGEMVDAAGDNWIAKARRVRLILETIGEE